MEELVIIPELENAAIEVAKTGLSVDGVESLKRGFAEHFQSFHEIALQASLINESQPIQARAMRLQIVTIRTAADKTRKKLKEDSLLRGKAIDGMNNILLFALKPVEDRLEAIENAEKIAIAKKKAELAAKRSEQLQPYVSDLSFFDLGGMQESEFARLLAMNKTQFEADQKAKEQAEIDRLAAVEASRIAEERRKAEEKAERERMKAENERLAKEAEAANKARAASESKAKAEREAAEKKLQAERKLAADKLELERKENLRLQALREVER